MDDKQVSELAPVGDPEPARRPNRGRFQAGDPRINRLGRPKGGDRAGQRPAGRLRTLFIPEQDLRRFLRGRKTPWITNLPPDYRFVAFQLAPERKGVVVTLYSEEFSLVRDGEAIPKFPAIYEGLIFRR